MKGITKRTMAAMLCGGLLLSVDTLMVTTDARADDHEADVTSLLNRYYALHGEGNADEAALALKDVLAIEPDNVVALRALGYHYQSQDRHREAAELFRRAASGKEGATPDTTMLMSAGYAYQAAELDADAAGMFLEARRTAVDSESYADACQANRFTAPLMRRHLDDPWGGSFYSDTVYLSRSDNTVTENRLRLNRYLDESREISIYGQLAYQDDLRSDVQDDLPQIYSDNYTSMGVGADWRPHPSVRFYGEASRYRDLLDIPGQERYRNDWRGGVSTFHAWGAAPECRFEAAWPLSAYGQFYGSLEYVGRYDNLLGQATLWQGVRLFENGMTSLSAYAKVNVLLDSEALFYNNLIEAGPGLSWRPSLAWPVELRLERLFGRYLDEAGPDGRHFNNTRLQLLINFNF